VFKFAQTIRVLSYGRVLAEGTPEEVRHNPRVIEAYLGAKYDAEHA
jgi:branched-chain amino acid transport system ATP-binding protein